MGSFDDGLGGGEPTPPATANPMHRPVRNPRTIRKRHLRLIPGAQIVDESHAGQISQIRRRRKNESGDSPPLAISGYDFPMGNRAKRSESGEVTVTSAASQALRELVPYRQRKATADRVGIAPSTFYRLYRGKNKTISTDQFARLRRIEGFSERFDALVSEGAPAVEFSEVARRMERAFGEDSAELIAYHLESLSETMSAEAIVALLKGIARAESLPRPSHGDQKKSPNLTK